MPPNNSRLKILIVDDTLTYRTILSRVIGDIDSAEVLGTAANGQLALNAMEKEPADLVLMDLEMPVLDGLETTAAMRKRFPDSQIVMISGTNRSSADLTMKALAAGAIDFIQKPSGDSLNTNMAELRQKLSDIFSSCQEKRKSRKRFESIFQSHKSTSEMIQSSNHRPASTQAIRTDGFDILAIGISTGGPNALSELIPALPKKMGVPIVIVQHMPPVFTASLAGMLNRKSALSVKEATEGETLLPDTVYIAPGGKHMVLNRNTQGQITIILNEEAPVNSCRPAVDVLFQSLPAIYGKRILSVIMTGMGNDGLHGVRVIRSNGGYCLTQSADSCVIYGMPRAVDENNLSNERVSLTMLPTRILKLLHKNQ